MNNHLANPFLILKEKCQQAWSGCLEIAEPEDNSVGWQIYLSQGKIQYATSTAGNQERLNYLWQQFKLGSTCPQVTANKEYEEICQWFESTTTVKLNLTEILLKLNQEAFAQIFSLEQAVIRSIENRCLPVTSASFSAKDLLDRQLIDSGKEMRKYFKNPFVRLELKKDHSFKFYKLWKELSQETEFNNFANRHKLSSILDYCSQNLIFYQFATSVELDILSATKYFQSFIKSQIIELQSFAQSTITTEVIDKENTRIKPINLHTSQQSINSITADRSNKLEDDHQPVIACIDDSKTVHKQVNLTLEAVGYRVINITDPTLALKVLSREQPILILMDINMPTMNGYDLCSMLRRSNKFSEIPIIMLTGRDGIIDRMKAKFVGSTDYLTKPFQPNALIEMVQKFVPSSVSI
ncbi:MAG: response regulator [Pleurocapsa sp.]